MTLYLENPGLGVIRPDHISEALAEARATAPNVFEAVTIGWCSISIPVLSTRAKELSIRAKRGGNKAVETASLQGVLLGTSIVRRLVEDDLTDLPTINRNVYSTLLTKTFTISQEAGDESSITEDFGAGLASSLGQIGHWAARRLCADTLEICLSMPVPAT